MKMNVLGKELKFPPVDMANKDGLLAIGGDLKLERIMLAYNQGIFPWYSDETPIMWWSPDPRFVLFPSKLKISKSTRQLLRKNPFKITFDRRFEEVIRQCQNAPRKEQDGTWITDELVNAFIKLHKKGFAHSVEVWQNNELVGGLYGLSIGKVYFGESMFSKVSNASKVGFITLVQEMQKRGISLVDCQVHTDYLESLGAEHITRDNYMGHLEVLLDFDSLNGAWSSWEH
jgi:leucyl/phenylalanyl-tRNA--protein transferase